MRCSLVCRIIDVASEVFVVLNKVGSYTAVVEDDIKGMYINVLWRGSESYACGVYVSRYKVLQK